MVDKAGTAFCSGALEANHEPGNRPSHPLHPPAVISDGIDRRERKQTGDGTEGRWGRWLREPGASGRPWELRPE